MSEKTIYALSTVFGKSGVAVIRISGEAAIEVVKQMTELNPSALLPRHAYFLTLLASPLAGEADFTRTCSDVKSVRGKSTNYQPLDKSLLVYFPAPHSFTGEDVVELHIHGSKAVIASVLESLSRLKNFRLAEPGEFSKRAFYNNKMDLTEAEGLADLIDSETSEQQKFALKQMEGNLKNLYDGWREDIIKILAHLEAYIDFPDEDIPDTVTDQIKNSVLKLKNEITQHLNTDSIGERLREGFRVVIVGPPNAGKSSLLNAIINREAVIVSDIAGTTRDAIDVHLDIKGYPVIFTDTAGLREAEDLIEQKGVEIAKKKIENADLVICLYDASTDNNTVFKPLEAELFNKAIYVGNKVDKFSRHCEVEQSSNEAISSNDLLLSALTRQGIDTLMTAIYDKIKDRFTSNSSLLITRRRYRESLNEAVDNLNKFNFDKEIELSAEDIRLAARAIGKITGHIEVDDILDKIFGDFCIGK